MSIVLQNVLRSLFCLRKNNSRNVEKIYTIDPIKTNANKTENRELKKPIPLLLSAEPKIEFAIDTIKKIRAASIPAFNTNVNGESTLAFKN